MKESLSSGDWNVKKPGPQKVIVKGIKPSAMSKFKKTSKPAFGKKK
jgi:hypothetical protein